MTKHLICGQIFKMYGKLDCLPIALHNIAAGMLTNDQPGNTEW